MPDELHPHALFATDEEWNAIQSFLKRRRAGESIAAPQLPESDAPTSQSHSGDVQQIATQDNASNDLETSPSPAPKKKSSRRKSGITAKRKTKNAPPEHSTVISKDGLTPSQAAAMKLLASGGNVFVTGGAGVGKTYLLHRFIKEHEGRVVVCAPSGIAAKRAGGTTIHRAFGLSKDKIKILDETDFDENHWLADAEEREYMAKHPSHRRYLQALLAADIVVIDEISMCRSDLFSYIMRGIRTMAKGRSAVPERGITEVIPHHLQVVLCGDFYQLPPVVTSKDHDAWVSLYPENPEGWAFRTDEWQRMGFDTTELTEVVRQKDNHFADALNQIRHGDADGLKYINEHCAITSQSGPYICATNQEARESNQASYEKLRGKEHTFTMETNGEVTEADIVCEPTLHLKRRTKLLILVNDKEGAYQNGTYGELVGFEKTMDGKDIAALRVNVNGAYVTIPRFTWEVARYEVVTTTYKGRLVKKVQLKTVGTFTQFPVRLGWALTAHKSQGQDYESCNIAKPDTFWLDGQLYVALSRAKSVGTLYLGKKLTKGMVKASKAVTDFFK